MGKTTAWQVDNIFLRSGLNKLGQSKHEAKGQIRQAYGRADWKTMGQNLGIHSYKTAKEYKQVWSQVGRFAKENLGIGDMRKLDGDHIRAYLNTRHDEQISKSQWQLERAAISKLDRGLNGIQPAERGFQEALESTKGLGADLEPTSNDTRAYEAPRDMIDALQRDDHKLCASIQYESGARFGEASNIEPYQLKGDGTIFVSDTTKGGKPRDLHVSPETYAKLESAIEENKTFQVTYTQYREDMVQACEATYQDHHGTHGLRHNYAQERMESLVSEGLSFFEAQAQVSLEMGHHREDVILTYLR